MRTRRRYQQEAMLHPEELWLADFPWDEAQAKEVTRWEATWSHLLSWIPIALAIVAFNGRIFVLSLHWFAKGIVIVFDLVRIVVYQLYAANETHQPDHHPLEQGTEQEVVFPLPDGEYGTQLTAKSPRYWELEVTAQTPGKPHHATFLVPVYAKPNRVSILGESPRIPE